LIAEQPTSVDTEFAPQNLEYLDELYALYQTDPSAVPAAWREYLAGLGGDGADRAVQRGPSFPRTSVFNPAPARDGLADRASIETARLQEAVDLLIRNYRTRGHTIARIDPLHRPRPIPPELDPKFYGFSEADLDRPFSTSTLCGGDVQTLRGIVGHLRNSYCRSISVEFMYIDDSAIRQWIERRMEETENRRKLSRQTQLRILTRLTDAVIFEEFIRRKYVGAKTFSLEGAESLIPLLDLAIEKAGEQKIREVVLAMAHRGRLNVLANIIGKSPREIFREFEDANPELYRGSGDVKYHLGYHNDFRTSTGRKLHLSLCFNPSHLEFVDPVAQGLTRAKQDRSGDGLRETAMTIMIHGDASFAGEGIVAETLNTSRLPGYTTGGTLHVIVNNQIGFTTPPAEGRSTRYASDVAKMLEVPIFHVNGEHPEAVAQVIDAALDFRRAFQRDVVVDMYCYRRWGHNEGDEPAFTQPLMVEAIERRISVGEAYLEQLLLLGEISAAEANEIAQRRKEHLERELSLAKREDFVPQPKPLAAVWKGYRGGLERPADDVETGVAGAELAACLARLAEPPAGFHVHRKLRRLIEARRAMTHGERPVDWATAEALAFASLAAAGYRVRLSGQDSVRGTFSQRHAALVDAVDGQLHVALRQIVPDQAPVEIWNSPLSEAAVLGFEYGYSLGYPDALVLWEAQFGDFVNAAQVIVDQFIASAEEKWGHLSGVVLLLPHGFEGQGPEHSSARPERFLQLAARENLQVVVPSTPAQYFHCLRRQVLRRWQKPLVVLTPKSLLRHPRVVSPLDEFTVGRFQRVIGDPVATVGPWSRVLLTSGKMYWELVENREAQQRPDVAIVRLEQLYPLSREQLAAALTPYTDGTPVYWVQEEPENMGAWHFLKLAFGEKLLGRFPLAGIARPPAASPATGSTSSYRLEQEELHARSFG
jgi:2-oxoglutarate dehydrogenase E1 component